MAAEVSSATCVEERSLLGSLWSSRKKFVGDRIGLPFEPGLSRIEALVQVPPQRPGVPDSCHEHAGDDRNQSKAEAKRDEPRHLALRHRRPRSRSFTVQDAAFSFCFAALTVSIRPFTTEPSATATRGAATSPWRSAPSQPALRARPVVTQSVLRTTRGTHSRHIGTSSPAWAHAPPASRLKRTGAASVLPRPTSPACPGDHLLVRA